MAIINIVVPPIHAEKFSGGLLCVLEYAKGLRAANHEVNIVPMLPSPKPRWISGDIGSLPDESLKRRLGKVARAGSGLIRDLVKRTTARPLMTGVRSLIFRSSLVRSNVFPDELQSGISLMYTRELMQDILPPADVTIAAESRAALPVSLFGTGRKYYFAQHYEPYFSVDMPNPRLWEHEALQSYRLGLNMIANSSWLQTKLRTEVGCNAALCPNAIDHTVYFGRPKMEKIGAEFKVISYGGRHAKWKGFMEMAEGMRLARSRLPGLRLRWLVYGPSLLKPSNSIAEFESLGFLQPRELAQAYRDADLLLSASWYESFPLFPLEAMACGLPVITTQLGTEEYAQPGATAEIVVPRDSESIAQSIVHLVRHDDYRHSLAIAGHAAAANFTWKSSVHRMERILFSD